MTTYAESRAARDFYWTQPPFDQNGRPASDASYYVLRFFFENRARGFTLEETIRELATIPREQVFILREQYFAADILRTDPKNPYLFRYNLRGQDFETQARLESSLLDYWSTQP